MPVESPLLDTLNPVQREAVQHTDGPVLIGYERTTGSSPGTAGGK